MSNPYNPNLPPNPAPPSTPPPAPFPTLTGPVLSCTNPACRHTGPTRTEEHGNPIVAVVIMVLCMLLPGLLYLLLGCYKTYHCANCNAQLQKAGII